MADESFSSLDVDVRGIIKVVERSIGLDQRQHLFRGNPDCRFEKRNNSVSRSHVLFYVVYGDRHQILTGDKALEAMSPQVNEYSRIEPDFMTVHEFIKDPSLSGILVHALQNLPLRDFVAIEVDMLIVDQGAIELGAPGNSPFAELHQKFNHFQHVTISRDGLFNHKIELCNFVHNQGLPC